MNSKEYIYFYLKDIQIEYSDNYKFIIYMISIESVILSSRLNSLHSQMTGV